MKKIILSLVSVFAVVAVAAGVTYSQFNDTEVSNDNTFGAGTIDLKVNDTDGPFTNTFHAENMVPGNTYSGGCVTLKNVGTVSGKLTLKASNFVSNENGLSEPETTDGDAASTEVDPSGYDNNTGDGELWDEMTTRFFLDTGAGSHTGNGTWDWDDKTLSSTIGTPSNDYSSYYSLPANTDLAADDNYVLAPNQSVSFCTAAKFVDDTTNEWWGAQNGLTNNMAMSDDAKFDLTFGLVQVNP